MSNLPGAKRSGARNVSLRIQYRIVVNIYSLYLFPIINFDLNYFLVLRKNDKTGMVGEKKEYSYSYYSYSFYLYSQIFMIIHIIRIHFGALGVSYFYDPVYGL